MKAYLKNYLFLCIPFICFVLGYAVSSLFLGNTSYPTPNLIGVTLHDAILQTSPFHINVSLAAQKECPGVAHGVIISQKPAPGRLIKQHQSIVVVTCKHPEAQLTPDLIGKTESQAQEICSSLRMKCKNYPQAFAYPTGTCFGQTPQKSQEIPDKKIIFYTAKDQSSIYLMPNLMNKPLEQVLEFLQKYTKNISIFLHNQKISAPYPKKSNIIDQKPLPGSFINLKNELVIQLEIEVF